MSHAVYPLAPHVSLSPPEGNEEASGSPFLNVFDKLFQ